VVLVRLDLVEIAALTNLEPVVAVELEEGRDARVLARHALNTRDGVARLQHGPVPPVAEVERLLALPHEARRIVAGDVGVTLDNPHELLARVVEVQLELVARGRDGLTARELEHVDQVLVADLGELATLVRVEVDVVDVEGRGDQVAGRDAVADYVDVGVLRGRLEAEIAEIVEDQVDADLVVLEGDQRQGQARVAAEPELERDVERVLRGTVADLVRGVRLATRAVVVAGLAALDDQVRELRDVANHLGIAGLLASLLRELVPHVEPLAVVLVDTLAADLELDLLDQVVASPVEPAELGTRAVRGQQLDLRQCGLEIHTVDQVTVALDRARDRLAETRGTVERVLDGLHGEVRVAAVHDLEKCDLRVSCEVNVLGTIGYELHKTPSCHDILYPQQRK